nr:Spy/CpxP family protein refolding chaperone [uncultured Psychroserpens sp.]
MKKNNILYLLLIVLIIMNGFFLFNYLGKPNHDDSIRPRNFIAKQLDFNEAQLKEFEILEAKHHKKMRSLGDNVKSIKDDLFKKITANSVNQAEVDSLITRISNKDFQKEREMFSRLRSIYELCDEEQKEKFSAILIDARKFDRPDRPEKPHKPE